MSDDLDIEGLRKIASEEATRLRQPDGSVPFNDLVKAVGARLDGFQVVPLGVILDAMEAEAAVRLH